ncbi:hypothetical protein J3R30DRAFT_1569762 [Lentinula aciculospora]|uniref:Ricin B lectin domain-containing protein n=1 Tax=Lentinula aciculospora TaxID=153920 RepID=A0A9W9DHG2_9AGAR|nr:hypothetical protein J3R30DRAFT_1569762 [Lentinula aciculospora]
MFSSSKVAATLIALILTASSAAASPTLHYTRQTACTPAFAEGTAYHISSNINDSYVWQFNGASAGTLSAVYLEYFPYPPFVEPWYLNETSTGGYIISSYDSTDACVLAPADTTLTTGSCSNPSGTDADISISCQSCTDTAMTACTLTVASTSECVNVPGDSDGDPRIRSLECTGTPEQLWDFVAASN